MDVTLKYEPLGIASSVIIRIFVFSIIVEDRLRIYLPSVVVK